MSDAERAQDMPHEIAALQESLGNSVYTVEQSNVRDKTVAIFGLGPTGVVLHVCRDACGLVWFTRGRTHTQG